MTIFYGGTEDQVRKQLQCKHFWRGLNADRISVYYKCVHCSCLDRRCTEDEYYKALRIMEQTPAPSPSTPPQLGSLRGKKKYHICTMCTPHHIDNCETCFGFGVLKKRTQDGIIPVRASLIETIAERDCEACPECQSTLSGPPSERLATYTGEEYFYGLNDYNPFKPGDRIDVEYGGGLRLVGTVVKIDGLRVVIKTE